MLSCMGRFVYKGFYYLVFTHPTYPTFTDYFRKIDKALPQNVTRCIADEIDFGPHFELSLYGLDRKFLLFLTVWEPIFVLESRIFVLCDKVTKLFCL